MSLKLENIISIHPIESTAERGIGNKYDKTMSIKFIPFKTCNYRCEYCCETFSEDKRKSKINYSNIQTIVKNIDNMYTKFKKQIDASVDDGIDLTIFGGETFFVDWTKYLKYIKTPIRKLTMISNFTCNKKLYEKMSKYCYVKRIPLRLIASFHASQTDIYSFFDRVSKIYEFIQNKNNKFLTKMFKIPKQSLSIQPVISSENIEIVRELYTLVLQSEYKKLVFSPNFLYNNKGVFDIDKKKLTFWQFYDVNTWLNGKKNNVCIEYYEDDPSEDDEPLTDYYTYTKSVEFNLNPINLKGWTCLDKYGVMIDGDTGEIKQRCENPGVSYGNIITGEYDFSKKNNSVKCNRDFCLLCMHNQKIFKP